MLTYEQTRQKFVVTDMYEDPEIIGRFESMEEAVNAACQRYHDTDGECDVIIRRVTSDIVHGWFYPVCPGFWSYVKRRHSGDFCLIGTAYTKEEAQQQLNLYLGDNCFKSRSMFFLCSPDCTLYDADGKEVDFT